jgi:hypothetical protein
MPKHNQSRGRWYVYRRATGEALIKGFEGDRPALDREMAKPAFMSAYNRPRQRAASLSSSDFPMSTLGGLVFWFTNGDIDRKDATTEGADAGDDKAGYPKWKKLAVATRKDYLDAFDYLRPEFDIVLTDIIQSDLYDLRDKCAQSKWGRFADQMISALSTMFTQGVKRGNRTGMTINPCRGTTLHGLRVSYAAWWKRTGGANNSEIADLLGDKSERMGAHYTRHVESEANVIRAFTRVKDAS